MPTLRQAIRRLRAQWILPPSGTVSLKDLHHQFRPIKRGSTRSLLLAMLANYVEKGGGSDHPYYRRKMPESQSRFNFASDRYHIDLNYARMESYDVLDPVVEANSRFDKRAAAAVYSAESGNITLFPSILEPDPSDALLERKFYGDGIDIYIVRGRCLGLMAFPDYFRSLPNAYLLWGTVSNAILHARSGWCGTFGPGVTPFDVAFGDVVKGDYDMSQMHLLPMAYRYYDELPAAREHLIMELLARGTIHRVGLDDIRTSGGAPNDWGRAGIIDEFGLHIRIGETENHTLMIHTARYLTNQLLYQRDHDPNHDNRRNGSEDAPTCTELMLGLLRNMLRDDFSEYNAKNYQTQTRHALLNLCSYAYDHEVRLAARMVLDYISAHIAISSNDLRRMVPFRRINDGKNVTQLPPPYPGGIMDVGLLDTTLGADPMAEPFAIQAGNTRAYETANFTPLPPPDDQLLARPWSWAIASGGDDAVMEALSDYRLPPSIHDLFVNDSHRRFYQRLHRVPQGDEDEQILTGRNCDNHELYAGSASYLITAGGTPATYAIDPSFQKTFHPSDAAQQLGVAVTTSFMPTGMSAGFDTQNNARDLIQFSSFSDDRGGKAINYGVAPDFACGHRVYLPNWCLQAIIPQRRGKFDFVNKRGAKGRPGFYLALLRDGDFTVLEAFDTWLYPNLEFDEFRKNVWERNKNLSVSGLRSNVEAEYITQNGNRVHFVIWNEGEGDDASFGARILGVDFSGAEPRDSFGDAGHATDQFLRGTVLNSQAEGVVEITNFDLGTKITLDMNDQWHPKRTASDTGEFEEAGPTSEVWVDFSWTGPSEGDFYRPFNTIARAAAAVADGGVIKIVPGWTTERPFFPSKKRIRLVAPIGGVTIGVR